MRGLLRSDPPAFESGSCRRTPLLSGLFMSQQRAYAEQAGAGGKGAVRPPLQTGGRGAAEAGAGVCVWWGAGLASCAPGAMLPITEYLIFIVWFLSSDCRCSSSRSPRRSGPSPRPGRRGCCTGRTWTTSTPSTPAAGPRRRRRSRPGLRRRPGRGERKIERARAKERERERERGRGRGREGGREMGVGGGEGGGLAGSLSFPPSPSLSSGVGARPPARFLEGERERERER